MLTLVGNPGQEHVGNHFRNAALAGGIPVQLCNSETAYLASRPVAKFNWWLRGHRPARLEAFSHEVLEQSKAAGSKILLSTGLAPLTAETLAAARKSGIVTMNFLTDDPWNPSHRAPWFLRALPGYDFVFSPRTANMEDLRRAGCDNVRYLPFAFAPEIHFPDPPSGPAERDRYASDVVFAGGADAERVPWAKALIESKLDVALYGGYWNRYPETRAASRGMATPDVLRKAISGGRVSLCLVRRANRDGHAMRTYELAAMGACILAEDTPEHRAILGEDGVAALYFKSVPEMLEKTRELLRGESLRERLRTAAYNLIAPAGNTYADRLATILATAGIDPASSPTLVSSGVAQ